MSSNRKTIYEALGREPVHPFPARMAPGIALDALANGGKPMRVLDPMMGSGTVIAMARSQGHCAVGVDIDPLAVLLTKVWTTAVDKQKVLDKAQEVLARAKELSLSIASRDSYPVNADRETREFVAYWFDDYVRRQLASLSAVIARVRDERTRNALWCAFSRLIITKQSGVSLAMDLAHSRPHKTYERGPIKPFNKFIAATERVVENCISVSAPGRGPAPLIIEGDARNLRLPNGSIDLVLTSPPYLNAIDYMRCSKFSLVWMGHSVAELRQLRGRSVGTESGRGALMDDPEISQVMAELKLRPKLGTPGTMVLAKYIGDLRSAIGEVARVLATKGRAIYVMGENTVRQSFIRNSLIVEAVADLAGLTLVSRRMRHLPGNRRYLPPPQRKVGSAALDSRMRREVVLSFSR